MKKILFIVSLFVSCVSYGQIVGPTGNTPYNRGIGVWDGTGDSLMAQQSDKRWTMAQKHDVYGVNARGNHWYGSLAGSSATVSTEGLIAIGHNAARLINTGGYGIYMGWQAGYNLPSASYGNIFIGGYRPGFNQSAGSRNLIFGYGIDLPSLTDDNQMNIMAAIFGLGVGEVTGQSVSTGKIGIFKAVPTEALDLVGNFRFSGALMPNNTAGTSGQVLTSAGAGAVPTWTTPAGAGYNLIQNEGSGLTARTTMNFIGYGVNAVDNTTKTDITIKGFNDENETTDLLTTNNTQTTQATVTIPSGSAGILTVHIHAQLDDQLGSFVSVLRIGYNKTAGGTLSLGTVQVSGNEYIGAGISAATATLDASSDNIRVRVTGETSKNIYWNSYYFLTNVIPEL